MTDQLVLRHTYAPAAWSNIASHGRLASAGVSIRSTTRSPSPRSAATAAAARYRPATSPVPSSPANSACPASRTGCSVSGSSRRLGTAEASTACCSGESDAPTRKLFLAGNKGSRPAGTFRLSVDWKRENGAFGGGKLGASGGRHNQVHCAAPQGLERYADQTLKNFTSRSCKSLRAWKISLGNFGLRRFYRNTAPKRSIPTKPCRRSRMKRGRWRRSSRETNSARRLDRVGAKA